MCPDDCGPSPKLWAIEHLLDSELADLCMILLAYCPSLLRCATLDAMYDQPALVLALKSWGDLSDIVQRCEYRCTSSPKVGLHEIRESLNQRFGDAAYIEAVVPYIDCRLISLCGFRPAILMSRNWTITTPSICFFPGSRHITPIHL
jgi:hypothetical protein